MRMKAIETNTLGDSTLASLLSELAAVERSDKKPNTTPLYLKIKALAYLHPVNVRDVWQDADHYANGQSDNEPGGQARVRLETRNLSRLLFQQ